MKNALRGLLADDSVMDELRESPIRQESLGSQVAEGPVLDALLEGHESAIAETSEYTNLEAIILLRGRPVLLIQDGLWANPESQEIRSWLGDPQDKQNKLVGRIPSIARIEIVNGASDYVGTGWMIDEGVMITNRHVAEEFGFRSGREFELRLTTGGARYQVRADFRREHERSEIAQVGIDRVLFMEDAGSGGPDMALVRLTGANLPAPIPLDDGPLSLDPGKKSRLAIVGYPAEDGRNDAAAMRNIFRGLYRVKRLSPGRVMTVSPNGRLLEHDCTTLGGNSGSPVINLETGNACGLHFAGTYRDRNLAVTAAWIKSRLDQLAGSRSIVLSRGGGLNGYDESPSREPAELADRKGYRLDFLGEGPDFEVPPPDISRRAELIAPVEGSESGALHYTHFSIVMRTDRRMPFFSACNIDGAALYNFPRGRDRWFFDGRIEEKLQIGEDLYRANNLDRGHLVRRLDPAWGSTREEAKQAELDTFAFTNCTPQHSRLNQQTWLSLEDYILGNAATRDLKISVFTGPVMADDDVPYRGVYIPREYWKVVVMVHEYTRQLSATGYLLSQADYLKDIEFAFGPFRTYQVPISEIEGRTGLTFDLGLYDPLNEVEGAAYREVRDSGDIAL